MILKAEATDYHRNLWKKYSQNINMTFMYIELSISFALLELWLFNYLKFVRTTSLIPCNFNETLYDWLVGQVLVFFTHIFRLIDFWLSYCPNIQRCFLHYQLHKSLSVCTFPQKQLHVVQLHQNLSRMIPCLVVYLVNIFRFIEFCQCFGPLMILILKFVQTSPVIPFVKFKRNFTGLIGSSTFCEYYTSL
jgi:hypothetical protein